MSAFIVKLDVLGGWTSIVRGCVSIVSQELVSMFCKAVNILSIHTKLLSNWAGKKDEEGNGVQLPVRSCASLQPTN